MTNKTTWYAAMRQPAQATWDAAYVAALDAARDSLVNNADPETLREIHEHGVGIVAIAAEMILENRHGADE